MNPFYSEVNEGGGDAYDIEDGISGTYLVEVHLLEDDAVDLGLGPGQDLEDPAGPVSYLSGQPLQDVVAYLRIGASMIGRGVSNFTCRQEMPLIESRETWSAYVPRSRPA